MQASLALAAPKIQGSNAAELLVQGSKIKSCPQKAAELQFQVQGSNAAELLVQGSNALKRVQGSITAVAVVCC